MIFKQKILQALNILPIVFFAFVLFANAQTNTTPKTVNDVFYIFTESNMTLFSSVLITVALITFLVGVVKFVGAGDNEEKRSQGRMVMIYGIVVMFVMFGMWGFVKILSNSFFDTEVKTPNYLPDLM